MVELKAEINAQVGQFLSTGVPLDHINSENHMLSLYTPFHKVVRELAIEHRIPIRNPVPESVHGNIKVKKGGGSSKALAAMIGYGIRHPFRSFRMMKLVSPNAFREEEKLAKQEGIPVKYKSHSGSGTSGLPAGKYTREEIENLPEPVQQYFHYCGYVGTQKADYAEVIWKESSIRL